MLTPPSFSRNSGFSLIELAVSVVIVGIMFALAVPSYFLWIQNSQIRTAAESIQNGLRFARAEAVRRNTPIRFQLTSSTISDWTVCLPSSTTATDCNNPQQTLQSRSGKEGSTNVVVGVWTSVNPNPYTAASTATPPNGVTFNGLGGAGAAGDITRVDVTNPKISPATDQRWLVVTISPSGSVLMCDPSSLLSSDDARRCN